MAAVKEAYPGKDLRSNAEEKAVPHTVDRVEALFVRKRNGRFERWKVASVLADGIMADPSKVPSETLDAFAKIAVELNKLVEPSSH